MPESRHERRRFDRSCRPQMLDEMIESSSSSSAAPIRICTSPSGSTMAIAGCDRSPNRLNTSADESSIWGNVSPYRSTNDSYSSSEPAQATPTNSTSPSQRCFASSTEGASRLQLVHHGAQNHSSTGRPANSPISIWPPPTSGAAKSSASGTAAAFDPRSGVDADEVAAGVEVAVGEVIGDVGGSVGASAASSPPPHATSARMPPTVNVARRTRRERRPDITAGTIASRCRRPGSPDRSFGKVHRGSPRCLSSAAGRGSETRTTRR
jgi:hypothetical protein